MHTDDFGTSQYVIYEDNYRYIEKTDRTDFKIWGKYYTTDTSIVFDYKDKDRLPYNYLGGITEKASKNKDPRYMELQVVDQSSGDPLIMATCEVKNAESNIIQSITCDMDGKMRLRKSDNIDHLKIVSPDFATQIVNYHEFKDFDVIVKMEPIALGGRMSEGCSLYYIDYLLEYQIDQKINFDLLSRNGVVYKKKID